MMMFFMAILYIVNSSGLIAYNKFLMSEGRFPFSIALVMCHMLVCSIFSGTLYCVRPDLFPALHNKDNAQNIRKFMYWILPISVAFAGTLVLSNQAYLYCSLAFLQMMKEGNLILVYVASL